MDKYTEGRHRKSENIQLTNFDLFRDDQVRIASMIAIDIEL